MEFGFSNVLDALPPGYRFRPTNEELIDYYLINKALGRPLPPNNIKVVDLYKFHPRKLSEMYESPLEETEWYFFTSRNKKYPNGTRPNRSVCATTIGDDNDPGGFWKASGADTKIYSHGKLVGYKKVLVFHEGRPKNRADVKKTNWIMYEFRVADDYIIPPIRAPGDTKLDDCVLCMIYENSKRHDANNQQLDHSQNHQDTVTVPNTNQDTVTDPNTNQDTITDPNTNQSREIPVQNAYPQPCFGYQGGAMLQPTTIIPSNEMLNYNMQWNHEIVGLENPQQQHFCQGDIMQLPNLPCNNDMQWNDHMADFRVTVMNLQFDSWYSQPSEAEISSDPFVEALKLEDQFLPASRKFDNSTDDGETKGNDNDM